MNEYMTKWAPSWLYDAGVNFPDPATVEVAEVVTTQFFTSHTITQNCRSLLSLPKLPFTGVNRETHPHDPFYLIL